MEIRTGAARGRGRALHTTALGGLLTLLLAVAALPSAAADDTDLTALDIEQLYDLEVTSVSKKAQRLTEAPAAVFVLSGDDIRRSGIRTIPEALRMVPGLQVARLSANRWAISSRGFNSLFSDKLLVLVDGRSVYTPLFAGVYWDTVDTLIEDIDRIEVIRGPGGTLWGANAVNGVINIVTRSAKDTQGLLAIGGGGNVDRFGGGRLGGMLSDDVAFRAYVKGFNNENFDDNGDQRAYDRTHQGRGGFRVEWTPNESSTLTLDGGAYKGESDATADPGLGVAPLAPTETDTEVQGGHVLARLGHVFAEGNDAQLQLYYDRTDREDALWRQWRNTVDVDFQHRFPSIASSEIVWGLGYRFTEDDVEAGIAGFEPDSRDENLYTGFLQGEVPLFDDVLRLTAGTKLEHNDHTGFELQPSARMAIVPNDRHTLWASVGRAVRTPARSNDDLEIDLVVDDLVRGNPQSKAEDLLAYEAGYRFTPTERFALDVAGFYNDYEDLVTLEAVSLTEFRFGNEMEGESYGVEVFATWRPLDWLELEAWYAFLKLDLRSDVADLPIPIGSETIEDAAPEHTAQIRGSLDLPYDVELDAALWYVDDVEAPAPLDIDSYFRFDLRLGWKPTDCLELSLAAQNLNDSDHREWGPEFVYQATRIPRTFYGAVTWRY